MVVDPYIITVIVKNNPEAVRQNLALLDDISDQLTTKGMDSYIRAMYEAGRYDETAKTLRVPWIEQPHRSESQEFYTSMGGTRNQPLIDLALQDPDKVQAAAHTKGKMPKAKIIWLAAMIIAVAIILIYWIKSSK